jgi:NTP pyrophosphatase (non-canonical NTP hydrolase)
MSINVLDQFALDCHELAKSKGFWEIPQDFKVAGGVHPQYEILKKMEKLALVTSEVGEAVEGIRKPGNSTHTPQFTLEEEEMADILIRVFDYCGGFNLRIGAAFTAKMEYNFTRAYKHGKLA